MEGNSHSKVGKNKRVVCKGETRKTNITENKVLWFGAGIAPKGHMLKAMSPLQKG